MHRRQTNRAILIFTRSSHREAHAKCLGAAARVLDRLRERTVQAASEVRDADLVIVGEPGSLRLPSRSRVLAQRGHNFAQRLSSAFEDVRALGYSQVVVIGTDAPGLEARQLLDAFQALESHDLVLGPAADGGVYLIGGRVDLCPRVAGVIWNNERVYAQLAERNPDAAILGECLNDIDGTADLVALVEAGCDDAELLRRILALLSVVPLPRGVLRDRVTGGGVCRGIFERGPPHPLGRLSKSAA